MQHQRAISRLLSLPGLLAALVVAPSGVAAQSLTSGGLLGIVVDDRGVPVPSAILTLESENAAPRRLFASPGGRFALSGLRPGRYALLAEQVGYQPVRMTGLDVVVGRDLEATIRLERRPPPITSVTEVRFGGTSASYAPGDPFAADEFRILDRRRDATDISRNSSRVAIPEGSRGGFVATANGLAPWMSRLMVDGVEETLLYHPGLPGDGATAQLFSRDGVSQGVLFGSTLDAEWRGAPGATLGLSSRRGGGRFMVEPFATYSGSTLGGAAVDNPADSSASSFQVGVALAGPIKGDTAGWFVRIDHQRLNLPTAGPSAVASVGLNDAIAAAAGDTEVSPWLSPTVRGWEGTTGMARLDLALTNRARVGLRLGMASWEETNPLAGQSLVNGAGSVLEASDLSAAAELALAGETWSSETRVGIRSSSRDWLGASLGYTGLAHEGIGLGGAATLPGTFESRVLEISEALQLPWGSHQFKLGGVAAARTFNYDWIVNGVGRNDFGSVDGFANGEGSWVRATAEDQAADLSTTEFALFVQDVWRITPELRLIGGVRYESQRVPQDAVALNVDWANVSGLRNDVPPRSSGVIAPRGGMAWDVGGKGRTLLRASAGLVAGQYDLAALAEAARYDGFVTVDRAVGDIGWGEPDEDLVVSGTAITMFDDEVKQPRAVTADIGLSTALTPGTTLSVEGGYRHTDYMLRRTDLNRPGSSFATDSDGRPIYGDLRQFGGLVVATPGTNRRFEEFDHVFGLASSGFVDYYEATLRLDHQMLRGLVLSGSYTFSRTRDNLVGQLSADPADRLSPFPDSLDGQDWAEGRSDFDVPHRLAVTARYSVGGSTPLTIAARFRFQSGLPFTPGYRDGVDVNGDGSGGNDPAAVGSLPGCDAAVGGFGVRNACRAPAIKSLDLHAGFGLGIGRGRRLALMVDVFNLISSGIGIVDRAAVLVDPDGSITTSGGEVTLPLVPNDNFGQLLSRRSDPRLIRIGLRLEN